MKEQKETHSSDGECLRLNAQWLSKFTWAASWLMQAGTRHHILRPPPLSARSGRDPPPRKHRLDRESFRDGVKQVGIHFPGVGDKWKVLQFGGHSKAFPKQKLEVKCIFFKYADVTA
jgi:hypothetical protein